LNIDVLGIRSFVRDTVTSNSSSIALTIAACVTESLHPPASVDRMAG
jgi:hypothetical protein